MKKKIIYVTVLAAICLISGFGGYYAVISQKPETVPQKHPALTVPQKNAEPEAEKTEEHYLAKIENEMLNIYEMPENVIYESMKAESLNFSAREMPALYEGIVFHTLPEVYEFLENSMS